MNHARLSPGTYRAITDVTVGLFCHDEYKSYSLVKAGQLFDVPRHVNGFWSAAVYYPDFGDARPEYERAVEPVARAS